MKTEIPHHINGTNSDRAAEYLLSKLPPPGTYGPQPIPTWAGSRLLIEIYESEGEQWESQLQKAA